jgi:MFS family permease
MLRGISGYKVHLRLVFFLRSVSFHSQKMIALSGLLGYLCLLASAFVTQLYQIFLFQGCLLGISLGISMPLYMALPSQWFLRHRGLATGIATSGSGIGGGIGSLIVRPLYVSSLHSDFET